MLFLSKRKLHHTKKRKSLKRLIVLLIILFFFGYIFIYRPASKTYTQAKKTLRSAQKMKTAFSQNDITLVENEMKTFKTEFSTFKRDASGLYWMQIIPILGGYSSDLKNGILAGESLIEAGQLAIKAIEPHADLIGFKKGSGSFTEKPAEDRIQTAVLALDTILADVDGIAQNIDEARTHIDKININRYPETFGKKPIRPRIKQLLDGFDTIATLFVEAKPLIKKFPDIMGVEKEKTYIVLFQNDTELRATGGFITAYAIFKVNKGKFQVAQSKDIYSLDDSIGNHPTAPREISTYHKGVSKFYIRDSNLSPDLPTSVKLFESLYKNSSSKIPYDGIITMDTKVLVDTLKILGDTEARGTRFSANIEPRCDCPQVIYKLLDEIDRPVDHIRENRKGILGDLLFALMQKALGFSPSQYWGPLSQELIRNLDEKHIQVYLKDNTAQKSLETIGYGGKMRKTGSDYLNITDVNFAGAKSNLYVKESVISKTTIEQDGKVKREVIIEYRNPYPASNCNLEAGQICINALLRNWLRVYVPQGSTLQSFQGSSKKVQTYDELGKTVFEGFLGVSPMGKSTVTVTYTVPLIIKNKKEYQLFIQKQAGTYENTYNVFVNDQKLFEGGLVKDQNIVVN